MRYPKTDGYTHIGIDMAAPGSKDHSAIAFMNGARMGTIIIDEAADWSWPKWYRNPIKWYKLRRLMRSITSQSSHNVIQFPHKNTKNGE